MTILDQSSFNNASTAYNAIFSEVFQGDSKGANNYEKWCRVDNRECTHYEFDFLSSFPRFREWKGKKVSKPTRANKHRIETLPYESTTSVGIVEFDQQPALVGSQIRSWLSGARGLINDKVIEKLITGNSALGYDGVAFFSSSHVNDDATTQSNYSTSALSQTSFRAAATAMLAYTDTAGRPLGIVPKKLIVGPSNAYIARDIIEAKTRTQGMTATGAVDAAASNVAATAIENVVSNDGVELIVEPMLIGTADNYWFLIGEAADAKPFIVNVAKAPYPQTNADNSQYLYGSPRYDFSIIAQLSLGFGLWQCAFGSFAA